MFALTMRTGFREEALKGLMRKCAHLLTEPTSGGRVVVALALVTAVLLSPPSSAESRPDIHGKVLDLDGKGLAGVTVVASVEPDASTLLEAPAGTASVPEQVGSAVTNGGGVFHLTFSNPEAVQSATLSDQTVSVILSASTPAGQVFHRVRLQATATGRYVAYEADVEADTAPSYRAALRAEGRDKSQSRIDGVSMGVPNVVLVPLPSTDGATAAGKAARGSFDPDIWCRGTGGNWFFKKAAGTAGRNPALMDQATAGKTNGHFKYYSSGSTSLEMAVTNRAGDFVVATGFAKGTSTSLTLSAPISTGTNAQWWVGWDFNLYDVQCQDPTDGSQYWSGYTEYRPWRPDGSIGRRAWTPFTCNTAYQSSLVQGAEVTVAKGNTVTKSASFALGGANLRSQQSWSTTVEVGYKAINASTGYGLCGDGAKYPYSVSRTRQT
jgi:hypothetical protein